MASQITETRKSNVSRSMVSPPMLRHVVERSFFLSFVAGFIALTWMKVGPRSINQYENVAVPAAQRCFLKHGRRAQREQ